MKICVPSQILWSSPWKSKNSPQTRIRNLEAVGTYAITIEWEDGHRYGIYHLGISARPVSLPAMPGKEAE